MLLISNATTGRNSSFHLLLLPLLRSTQQQQQQQYLFCLLMLWLSLLLLCSCDCFDAGSALCLCTAMFINILRYCKRHCNRLAEWWAEGLRRVSVSDSLKGKKKKTTVDGRTVRGDAGDGGVVALILSAGMLMKMPSYAFAIKYLITQQYRELGGNACSRWSMSWEKR